MSAAPYHAHIYYDAGERAAAATLRDALTLLTVGAAHGDARLTLEGRRRHLAAIRKLGRQVATQPAPAALTAMVATISVLLSCESLRELSRGRDGWVQHCDGLAAVVRANGTGRLAGGPVHDRVSLLRARHICLMSALFTRRALDPRLVACFSSAWAFLRPLT